MLGIKDDADSKEVTYSYDDKTDDKSDEKEADDASSKEQTFADFIMNDSQSSKETDDNSSKEKDYKIKPVVLFNVDDSLEDKDDDIRVPVQPIRKINGNEKLRYELETFLRLFQSWLSQKK
jgi:hypothetical protein